MEILTAEIFTDDVMFYHFTHISFDLLLLSDSPGSYSDR